MPEIDYEEKNLVKTKRGTLPILLTCPHNGSQIPPGVPPRNGSSLPEGCPQSQFKIKPDKHTSRITDRIAEEIFALTN
jgi:N-formylglutamate amidohydrolase